MLTPLLDVLTTETLRTDFLDLWSSHQLPTKSVLMVTHNIEQAVLICDRLIVLSSGPARIAAEIAVTLSRPRDRSDKEFGAIVDDVYAVLTARTIATLGAQKQSHGMAQPLPPASVNRMSGLIEILAAPPHNGRAALADLARPLSLDLDHVFPIAEGLHILGFAELSEGALRLTAAGQVFASADTEARKRLFREHLLRFVPLSTQVYQVSRERQSGRAPRQRCVVELEDHLTQGEAAHALRAATAWDRYAELFAYNDKAAMFSTIPAAP